MTQYELPDGFFGMETAPRGHYVNVVYSGGRYGTECYPFESTAAGWAPIVPLKAKAAWSMEISENGGWFDFRHNGQPSHGIATGRIDRKTANKLLAVLNEVMP